MKCLQCVYVCFQVTASLFKRCWQILFSFAFFYISFSRKNWGSNCRKCLSWFRGFAIASVFASKIGIRLTKHKKMRMTTTFFKVTKSSWNWNSMVLLPIFHNSQNFEPPDISENLINQRTTRSLENNGNCVHKLCRRVVAIFWAIVLARTRKGLGLKINRINHPRNLKSIQKCQDFTSFRLPYLYVYVHKILLCSINFKYNWNTFTHNCSEVCNVQISRIYK